MAKKKKHKINKNRSNKVVKRTSENIKTVKTTEINTSSEDTNENLKKSDITNSVVINDVKYSLLLLLLIVASFVILYLILQNKTASDQIYGLIKISF